MWPCLAPRVCYGEDSGGGVPSSRTGVIWIAQQGGLLCRETGSACHCRTSSGRTTLTSRPRVAKLLDLMLDVRAEHRIHARLILPTRRDSARALYLREGYASSLRDLLEHVVATHQLGVRLG